MPIYCDRSANFTKNDLKSKETDKSHPHRRVFFSSNHIKEYQATTKWELRVCAKICILLKTIWQCYFGTVPPQPLDYCVQDSHSQRSWQENMVKTNLAKQHLFHVCYCEGKSISPHQLTVPKFLILLQFVTSPGGRIYAALDFGFAFLNWEYRETPARAIPVPASKNNNAIQIQIN